MRMETELSLELSNKHATENLPKFGDGKNNQPVTETWLIEILIFRQ